MSEVRKDKIIEILRQIAPEANAEQLEANTNLRKELALDSVDYLYFLVGIHEAFDVEIPERDYGKLQTLDQIMAYVGQKKKVK